MVVHWLQDRLTVMQPLQLQLHDVDVVAVRMQRCKRQLGALRAIKTVIIVRTDMRDAVCAKNLHQTLRHGGFASCAVADDADDDGT
jgi:hypothetical protein